MTDRRRGGRRRRRRRKKRRRRRRWRLEKWKRRGELWIGENGERDERVDKRGRGGRKEGRKGGLTKDNKQKTYLKLFILSTSKGNWIVILRLSMESSSSNSDS